MEDLTGMTPGELEKLLSELREHLEEVEEERMFVLRQTGVHLPGKTVREYEAEVNELKAKIDEVEIALRSKKTDL